MKANSLCAELDQQWKALTKEFKLASPERKQLIEKEARNLFAQMWVLKKEENHANQN